MDPVELVRRDTGAVVGYICGSCSSPHLFYRLDGSFVIESQAAENCCRCLLCKAPREFPRSWLDGLYCASCKLLEEEKSKIRDAERAVEAAKYDSALKAALVHSPYPAIAQHLRYQMSEWSEDQWCASWLGGLEYMLWEDTGKNDEFRKLGELCGGWWVYQDGGPMFVPMAAWLLLYEAHKQEQANKAG